MITIHMATYCRYSSGLLVAAVESVLSQDFRDFEFIICDDCSKDGTSDYLRSVASCDGRIRIIRNLRNVNSVAISLGRCFQEASPDRPYITWMFDDCVLLPGALELLVHRMKAVNSHMLFGVTNVKLSEGRVLQVGRGSVDELRKGVETSPIVIPNGGMLIHRDVFSRVGWYDPSVILRRSCDWDLFRRMLRVGTTLEVLPDVVMEEHGDLQPDSLRNSFTTTLGIMMKFITLRDVSGLHLDLPSCLAMPQDWIPPGHWTDTEIGTMQFIFLEYFLSIGDLPRAIRWAKRMESRLPGPSLTLGNLRGLSEAATDGGGLLAAGAYAGVMLGLYKPLIDQASEAA